MLLVNREGESKGFVNDWDGGPDFWPIGSISDNQVFMPVNVMNLQKILEENKSGNVTIKYPDRQKQLSGMISGMDISENPVLMVVTMKTEN